MIDYKTYKKVLDILNEIWEDLQKIPSSSNEYKATAICELFDKKETQTVTQLIGSYVKPPIWEPQYPTYCNFPIK